MNTSHSNTRRHTIDLVFPIVLLILFATAALVVLILSAQLYAKTNHRFQMTDEKYSVLNYISEKCRQQDSADSIYIETIDQVPCLALDTILDDAVYTTYIYACDGYLMELFTRQNADISLHSGQRLMAVSDLSMQPLDDHLIRLIVTDADQNQASMIIAERSRP